MRLKKGQVIYWNQNKYTVINMIEFKEDTWIWQEYELRGCVGDTIWLSVENNEDNETEYSIYKPYNGYVNTNELSFIEDNIKYNLLEKGTAIVKDYFGNADVDRYELVRFFDYISEDKTTIISVENWDGEIEKSIGLYVDNNSIRITEEIDQVYSQQSKARTSGGSGCIVAFVIGMIIMCVFPIISSLFSGLFVNKSIEKYFSKEKTKYEYVTSVTSNVTKDKAKVYKYKSGTLNRAVTDIIDGVPEGITKVIDDDSTTDEDGIGLQTSKEYAYVYEEGGVVYIQVSSKDYVSNSGTTYHSHRSHYYHRGYNSTRTSSTYTSYANSARQSSINSRTSSGGGTGFGK